jgi:hypothetical protein
LLFPLISLAEETEWKWVKNTNNIISGWRVSKGIAKVTINQNQFYAELFEEEYPETLHIVLKGNLSDGKITIVETKQETDYTGSTYHGTYKKKEFSGFGDIVGSEAITLSDGWGMIGLTRSIKAEHNNSLK